MHPHPKARQTAGLSLYGTIGVSAVIDPQRHAPCECNYPNCPNHRDRSPCAHCFCGGLSSGLMLESYIPGLFPKESYGTCCKCGGMGREGFKGQD